MPDENGDPLVGLSDDSIFGEHVIDDKDLEGILRSKYKDIMEHTAEKRGDPVVPELAGLMKETWGKLMLSTESKKKMSEGCLIPSNCKPMVTPKMNTEVYIRFEENSQKKEKAMQERQKVIAKATVLLLVPFQVREH